LLGEWRGSCNPLVLDPPEALLPYVTMWGLDPVYQSANLPNRPTAAHFPPAGPTGPAKSIAEVRNVLVDVAPHDVHFDAGRDLWYCDIEIDAGASYFPFVRLALARYQADSIADTHLSPVVAADFIQLAPGRTASVTPVAADPRTFFVTLTGPTFTSAFTASRQATVAVERQRTDVPDDELGWLPVSTTALTNPFGFWQGQANLPSGPRGARFRFVFEERELLPRGDERSPQGYRVVHTDIIDAAL
jgi:hypothetical protein